METAASLFPAANPLLDRLSRMEPGKAQPAGWSRVLKKCAVLFLAALSGLALEARFRLLPASVGTGAFGPAQFLAITLLLTLPFPLSRLNRFLPAAAGLYCFGMGLAVSWLARSMPAWQGAILEAAVLILAAMLALMAVYFVGVQQLSATKRGVLTGFVALCVAGVMLNLCRAVPGLTMAADFLRETPALNLPAAGAFLLLAVALISADFAAARRMSRSLPREREWEAAFCLIFSMVWLFMKGFTLAARSKNERSEIK